MKKQKVFGIGFHRTGTTTLQTSLEVLGYKVVGMRELEWQAYIENDFKKITETIEVFDGFRDMPWPLMYKNIHKKFPDAKFILSYRDPEEWVASCVGNYKARPYEMFKDIYGFNKFEGNEDKAKLVYIEHIDDVREYFKSYPDVFLEYDFTKHDGSWNALCDFLSEPVPSRDVPHANKRPRSLRDKIYHRVFRSIRPGAYRKWVRDKG